MSENFAARLAQANLVTKNDIATFVKKTDFNDKLKNLNKKVTSNKTKHAEAGKKITFLTNEFAQISEKGDEFLFSRMYFIGNDGYQNFLVFTLKKLLIGYRLEYHLKKIKPFDANLELAMSNLANSRIILKFNIFVLVQKSFSAFYSNFILNLYMVCIVHSTYELNN